MASLFDPLLRLYHTVRRKTTLMRRPEWIKKPDAQLLEQLLESDPRIKYHPTAEKKNILEDGKKVVSPEEALLIGSYSMDGPNHWVYGVFVFEDLEKRITEEHKDGLPVLIRGTVVNVGDSMTLDDGSYMKSISEILRDGTERVGDYTRVTGLTEESKIQYRTHQWLVQSTEEIKDKADSDQESYLFPAIIVFDKAKLDLSDGPYQARLPISEEERTEAIKGIYILDFIQNPN